PEGDVAWLLTVARRLDAGAVLYSRDLVEFNPPLAIQLSLVAVRMGRWVQIDTILAWRLLVAVVATAALTLSWTLLRDALSDADRDLRASMAVLLAAALLCLPGIMFGQREHLIVLGYVPYLVAAGLRAADAPISRLKGALVGVALALAVSIKPHYALAILLVELGVRLRKGNWHAMVRIESIVGVITLLIVQAAAAIQFPGYLSFAVPLALTYYPAYGAAQLRPSYFVYLVAALASLAVRGVPPGVAMQREIFALAGVGAFGGYLLQGQGWEYQFLPAQSFFIVALALSVVTLGLDVARKAFASRLAPSLTVSRTVPRTVFLSTWLALMVAAVAAMTTVRTIRINRHERSRIVTNVHQFVEQTLQPGRPRTMASMTLSLFPAAPVAELVGAEWASRFSCLWLLPGITEQERAVRAGTEQPKDGRTYLESAVVEDFTRWQPTLVLVDREQPRVLDEILKASTFRDQWRHYRSAGVVESVEVFVRDKP
ncbi:MAG: hypothetical protein ABMA15_23460, partial [Vicinamibacterales bacterium]